ncbi:unnamed protein product [Auanema sp. JU1783]|nr:unnamed protein product [Auanema sp. JU1783]
MSEESKISNPSLFEYSNFTTYVFEGETEVADPVSCLPVGSHHVLPWISSHTISLPGEIVPFHMETGSRALSIIGALEERTYLVTGCGNMTDMQTHSFENGILVELIRYELMHRLVSAYGRAKQKVEILKYYEPHNDIKYETCMFRVAPDYLPPDIKYLSPTTFQRLSKDEGIRTVANIYNVPAHLLRTKSHAEVLEKLENYMLKWYTETEVFNTLKLGLAMFTYWVSFHTILSEESKRWFLLENEVFKRIAFLEECILEKPTVMCLNCNNPVANISDLDRFCEHGAKALFVNRFGHGHNLVMFKKIVGFDRVADPAKDFTWFPGYFLFNFSV